MTPTELNAVLATEHPAAHALLSPLGRRAALPLGIPQQAAQARDCDRKATIGEITRGDGTPLALPSLASHFAGLDPRDALRYAPQHGVAELRSAWRRKVDPAGELAISEPVVTAGITHGLSLCAELFTGPDVPVVIPLPYWDNYEVIYTLKTGAPIRTFPFYAGGGFDVAGLARALAFEGPRVVLLNFPANPTGYTPRPDEAEAIVEALAASPGPLLVVCDDAYQGLYFDPGARPGSLFPGLVRRADPDRMLVCKVDGATKELVFFGGRVGFLTFSAPGRAGAALAEKAAALIRASISSVAAPSQAAVLAALRSPTLAEEQRRVRAVLEERYWLLRESLERAELPFYPFNSGCFALLPVPEGMDCEEVRQRLIREQSVGVIAIPQVNALRVAFCSIDAPDIPDLVARISRVLR